MIMNHKQEIGSYTAKGGFENEKDIVYKFNTYQSDNEAQLWLYVMGYDYSKIDNIRAIQIPPRINRETALSLGVTPEKYEETIVFKKADIQIRLEIVMDDIYYTENISLKKADSDAGYNQIDKRTVDKYQYFWNIPESICETLKYFTGEIKPKGKRTLKDPRRMYIDEMDSDKANELLRFFAENKTLIASDIIRGRGALSADWFLVTRKNGNSHDWIIKDINSVCNFFVMGDVEVTSKGNLKMGRITVQRKGGTPDPESLQFKLNPLELFDMFQ
jgi:hypothetical protein